MCASGGLVAAESCMLFPATINVNGLISQATILANTGQIDATRNIQGDRVYIYHGQSDITVYPGMLKDY